MPLGESFQESRMPGNPLVRFDEGRVGRTARCPPSLLLYRLGESPYLSLPKTAAAPRSGMDVLRERQKSHAKTQRAQRKTRQEKPSPCLQSIGDLSEQHSVAEPKPNNK